MLYDQECSVQGQRIEPFFFFSGRPASFSCLLKSGVSHQQIFQLLVFQTGRFSMKVSHMSFSIVQQPYKSPFPPPVLLQIFQILFSSLYGLMLFMVPDRKKVLRGAIWRRYLFQQRMDGQNNLKGTLVLKNHFFYYPRSQILAYF